jgi:hypothetical protein
MSTHKEKVKEISDRIHTFGYKQIVIDLIEEWIEPLLIFNEEMTGDDLGAAAYTTSTLLEVFDCRYEKDVALLTELDRALNEWLADHDFVNKTLGLPPNK